MTRYRSPGIFIESVPPKNTAMRLIVSGVTGFIGITEKGPLHQGVRITNFNEFKTIFGGFTSYGNLAYSVFGFFSSGGKECIIVRTAHMKSDEPEEDMNIAAKAFLDLKNQEGEVCTRITARSEGSWGNIVKIKLWHNVLSSSPLSDVAHEGQDQLVVESVDEFHVGDMVCVRCENYFEYKKIRSINDNRIFFYSNLKHNYDAGTGNSYCERLCISLTIINDKEVEEYLYLSLNEELKNYFVDEINKKSNLVTIEDFNKGTPVEVFYDNLASGRNGVLGLTPGDFIGQFKGLDNNSGIGVFEAFDDVSIIAAPDLSVFQDLVHKESEKAFQAIYTVQRAMVDQCERLGNRFAVLDAPDMEDPLELVKYSGRFDTASAALYHPRIQIINPEDITGLTTVTIPPSGHIAGVYVHCDSTEGLYRAPANKFLQGAVGIRRNIENDFYDIIYEKGINCLRYTPGRGVKIWGARTLSSVHEWRYINVRRTFSAIRDALRLGSGWAVFEPNDALLRKRLIRHVYGFLLDLWKDGYMRGTVPEEGFYVRCDDELNPPENIDAGIVTVEVGLSIARPAEFLVIKITGSREDSVVSFED